MINNLIMKFLIEHEERIAQLYNLFAIVLPEQAAVWKKLVVDEKAHADVLRELDKYLSEKKIRLNETRVDLITEIQPSIEFIRSKIEFLKHRKIDYLEALSLADDIESWIVESKCFKIFSSDSPRMVEEFTALLEHTKQHSEMIKKLLKEQRKKRVIWKRKEPDIAYWKDKGNSWTQKK